ncbi:sialic acid TRAP transporter permease protein SiaT (plasmid) [Maritalea myrionectae]|uniref:Sialic acid TRAP transporter permease protein SiaT n=1 Tax=Maritalea myrionectae TaxID=454601 RepID=A0A2R4MJC1_9HYPH|nr:TRAP transporter large permease subunit [Maritalea myrionectae]AVX06068.1 sialic acid TRAP transporter permease protein SiaT [Maritalea myrionectae]
MAEFLPLFMFLALALFLFSGFPVAFILAGVGLAFALIAIAIDPWLFDWQQFNAIPVRIHGAISENLILTAIPMFIFMGTMLEKSGVANDLLNCLQVLLKRVPGGLALSVVIMGTILAATTGIIGASVIMMSLLALPVMMEKNYSPALATGTVAASGTLGILIPPSIMLVIMADLLSKSVGNLFIAALVPGFMLASFYAIYIIAICWLKPELAPKADQNTRSLNSKELAFMILRSFLPPVMLIIVVLGSILAGFATPTEAASVGAFGAILLGFINLVVLPRLGVKPIRFAQDMASNEGSEETDSYRLRNFFATIYDVLIRSALTNAMIFGIFIGATLFAFVFRQIGGEEVVIHLFDSMGLGSWGVLLSLMALVFVLGFFFDWIEITLIVLPVFAPIISGLDFGTHLPQADVVYWFAILMAINLQTSFLTPPFGFALFYLKAVAPKEIRIQQIYKGIVPFVLLQLLGLILVIAFPQIAMWLPNVLLG